MLKGSPNLADNVFTCLLMYNYLFQSFFLSWFTHKTPRLVFPFLRHNHHSPHSLLFCCSVALKFDRVALHGCMRVIKKAGEKKLLPLKIWYCGHASFNWWGERWWEWETWSVYVASRVITFSKRDIKKALDLWSDIKSLLKNTCPNKRSFLWITNNLNSHLRGLRAR